MKIGARFIRCCNKCKVLEYCSFILLAHITYTIMNDKSLRRERFENVAGRRTQKILELLDTLANCANKSNYEYSEDDVRKMFGAIKDKIKTTEASFGNAINRSKKNKFNF